MKSDNNFSEVTFVGKPLKCTLPNCCGGHVFFTIPSGFHWMRVWDCIPKNSSVRPLYSSRWPKPNDENENKAEI